jgi:hypothetical protein
VNASKITAGIKSGKVQNDRMFFWFAPENGPWRLITACRMSAKTGREQSQQTA